MLGVVGALDYPTDQAWTGLEIAIHPTHTHWIAPVGRLGLGWGFGLQEPLVAGELGLMGAVAGEEGDATVRFGLVARALATRAPFALPVELSPARPPHVGIAPALMAAIEFEWAGAGALTVGFRAGAGSSAYLACPSDATDLASCVTWSGAFAGGFTARFRLGGGLAMEAVLGPSSSLALGWAL